MILLLLYNLLRVRVGVSDLFYTIRARYEVLKCAVSSMKIANPSCCGIVFLFCLALALSLMILQAGDVERNPGPNDGKLAIYSYNL